MATLTSQPIATSYEQLLSLPDGGGNGATLVALTDGDAGTTFALKLATTSISIDATDKFYLDGGTDTYLHEASADKVDFVVGGQTIFRIDENGGGSADFAAVMATNKLYFDGGGDTFIQESAADIMDFYAGSVHMLSLDEENDEIVFNEGGADIDFRVESDDITHTLFVQGSNGKIGINTNQPNYQHDINGIAAQGILSISTWKNDALGSKIILLKSKGTSVGSYSTVADNDVIGEIAFWGAAAGSGAPDNAAYIKCRINGTPYSGSDTSDIPAELVFATTPNGTDTPVENFFINNAGNIGIGSNAAEPEGKLSIENGMHVIAVSQDIRFADSGDNTVIVEISGYKIPSKAIITWVAAVIVTDSDLSTHAVNIQMSATSGTAADSAISSGTELLGAGATGTDSTDSTSVSDITLGSSASDEKDVWINRTNTYNSASDKYIYVCNAGTGNGTINSTEGTLSIMIEYFGMD